MNPRLEALLAVDPRALTEAERAALDAALGADDDAAHVALGVALDAQLADELADPLVGEVPRRSQQPWFAVAAAVLVLAAVVAIVVVLRSSSADMKSAREVAPAPEPLPERKPVAPPPAVERDDLRPLPIGAARPKPRKAAGKNPRTAKRHVERALASKKAGDHASAAFAYVDAFRAMPSDPKLAYAAAGEMELAGWCSDAAAWLRIAITLDPDGDLVADAKKRADLMEAACFDLEPAVSLVGPNADEARVRYHYARKLYEAGDYRGAAHLFAGAYDGLPVPDLAYNVAAAYHRSDDCANTVAWFRHYLAVDEDASDRAEVEEIIAAYDKVGCKQAVTDPPPSQEKILDPKQQFTAPKEINTWEEARDTPARLADQASEAAKRGNYGKAYKLCDDVLDLDPDNRKARMICVIASCKMKNGKRARMHYEHLSASSRRAVVQLCKSAGIEFGESAIPEQLSRTDITKAVGSVRSRVGECGKASGYVGTLKVRMTIEPDGRVSSATADPGGDIGACVEQVVKSLRFRETQKSISVSYPFVFR